VFAIPQPGYYLLQAFVQAGFKQGLDFPFQVFAHDGGTIFQLSLQPPLLGLYLEHRKEK
jgi:hypothetical protein